MTKTLIITGGGTGGHIFPGLAVAEAWQNLSGNVVWVGSNQGKEKTYVPDFGVTLKIIPVNPIKGKGVWQSLKTALLLPKAIWQGIRLLRQLAPDVVLGVGGYVSFPVSLAACLLGIPTAIAEQNSHAGLANRILSRFVKKIFLSFEDDAGLFPKKKTSVLGNPIRSTIQRTPYPETNRPFFIFATGGSLGATTLNQIFCETLDLLKPHWPQLRVVHQTGDVDFIARQKFYQDRPQLHAECHNFIRNMQNDYAKAHLILCRAGASTATEIAICGRPALFVPYPYAADDHQTENANYFVKRGAAWMIQQADLQAQDLAERILHWMEHHQELKDVADKMAQTAKPLAKHNIALELMAMTKNYV